MAPKVSEEHRAERMQMILDAAEVVFKQKGYNATTMEDIIQESNISRGGIYTYFKNTEDIFLAIMQRRDDSSFENIPIVNDNAWSHWKELNDELDGFYELVTGLPESLAPALFEYYFTAGWKSKKHVPLLQARYEKAIKMLVGIIQKGVDAGEFKPVLSVTTISWTIISFLDGIGVANMQLGPEKIKMNEQFEALRSYLLLALKPNEVENKL